MTNSSSKALNVPSLLNQLKSDEGLSLLPYKDSLGNWTIGYGHLLASPCSAITIDVAEQLLEEDVRKVLIGLLKLPWFGGLPGEVQEILANMAFNMGVYNLLGFHFLIEALKRGDFAEAGREMLDSKWATQVPARVKRLSERMKHAAGS